MRLRYIIGTVTDFASIGIDVTTERKSIDGTKTFIHQESLSDEQFDAVLEAGKFEFMSNTNPVFIAMINGPEWTIPEE